MPEQRIVDYIRDHMKLGTPEDQIRKFLIDAGWQEDQVNEGFDSVHQDNAPVPQMQETPQPPEQPSAQPVREGGEEKEENQEIMKDKEKPATGNGSRHGFMVSVIAGILILASGLISYLIQAIPMIRIFLGPNYILLGSIHTTIIQVVASVISGLIIIYGSIQMRKSGHEKTAGKLVILFSVINLIIIGTGGIISAVGSLIGIVGGIIGHTKK